MSDQVNLTIDGHEVSVPEGHDDPRGPAKTSRDRGPALLLPPGDVRRRRMCRLCLVEVEGRAEADAGVRHDRDGRPGGATPMSDAGEEDTAQGVLEFYLVNHPLDCPICDMSGECNLQDYVHAEGPRARTGPSSRRAGLRSRPTSAETSSSTGTAA